MFGYSISPNHFPSNQVYKEYDDAVFAGVKRFPDAEQIYVGRVVKKSISDFVSEQMIADFISAIRDRAATQVNSVAVTDWLPPDATGRVLQDLLIGISGALEKWAIRQNQQPLFLVPKPNPIRIARKEMLVIRKSLPKDMSNNNGFCIIYMRVGNKMLFKIIVFEKCQD